MDGVSELVRDRRDISKLSCEVQEDETLFSLAVAREGSPSLPCSWKDVNALFFDHPLRIVIEILIEVLHHREMQVICLIESEVLVCRTKGSSYIPNRETTLVFDHPF